MVARWLFGVFILCLSNLALADSAPSDPCPSGKLYRFVVQYQSGGLSYPFDSTICIPSGDNGASQGADTYAIGLCYQYFGTVCTKHSSSFTTGFGGGFSKIHGGTHETLHTSQKGFYVDVYYKLNPTCIPTHDGTVCAEQVEDDCYSPGTYYVTKYQSACVLNDKNKFCRVTTKPGSDLSYVPAGETEFHFHTYYTGEYCEPSNPTAGSYSPVDGSSSSVHYWPDSGATSTTPDPNPTEPTDGTLRADLDALRVDHDTLDANTADALQAHRNLIDNFSVDLFIVKTTANETFQKSNELTSQVNDLKLKTEIADESFNSLVEQVSEVSYVANHAPSRNEMYGELDSLRQSMSVIYNMPDRNEMYGELSRVYDQFSDIRDDMVLTNASIDSNSVAIAKLSDDFSTLSNAVSSGMGTAEFDDSGIITALNNQTTVIQDNLSNVEIPEIPGGSTEIGTEYFDLNSFVMDKVDLNIFDSSAACPPDVVITVLGETLSITYTPFCDFADYVRPAILLIAWIGFAYVVMRGRKN